MSLFPVHKLIVEYKINVDESEILNKKTSKILHRVGKILKCVSLHPNKTIGYFLLKRSRCNFIWLSVVPLQTICLLSVSLVVCNPFSHHISVHTEVNEQMKTRSLGMRGGTKFIQNALMRLQKFTLNLIREGS